MTVVESQIPNKYMKIGFYAATQTSKSMKEEVNINEDLFEDSKFEYCIDFEY